MTSTILTLFMFSSALLLLCWDETSQGDNCLAKMFGGGSSPRSQPKVDRTLANFEGLTQPPKTC